MPRRVKRPEDKSELMESLRESEDGGIFDTYKDIMLFAAALAANKGESKPFQKSEERIQYDIFTKYSDNEALIYLLGLFRREDLSILSDDNADERLNVLEQYANAGLEEIDSSIKSTGGSKLDAIINLIVEAEEDDREDESEEPNLEKMLESME